MSQVSNRKLYRMSVTYLSGRAVLNIKLFYALASKHPLEDLQAHSTITPIADLSWGVWFWSSVRLPHGYLSILSPGIA